MTTTEVSEWPITIVTGMDFALGLRLHPDRPWLEHATELPADSGEVLTDAPLNGIIRRFPTSDDVATILAVRAEDSLRVLRPPPDWHVTGMEAAVEMGMRINGGDFVPTRRLSDLQREGEDLVTDAYVRAAAGGRLHATPGDGFGAPIETVHGHSARGERHSSETSYWASWHASPASAAASGSYPLVDLRGVIGPTPTR